VGERAGCLAIAATPARERPDLPSRFHFLENGEAVAQTDAQAGGEPPAPESCRSAGSDRGEAMAMGEMLGAGPRSAANRQPTA